MAALVLWVVGVQASEALASVGLAGCLLAFLLSARRAGAAGLRRALREWWPLALFLAWGMLGSTLAGRPPSGSGAARLSDWLALPAGPGARGGGGARGGRVLLWVAGGVLLVSSAVAGLQHFGVWPGPETMASLSPFKISFNRVYEPIPGAEGRFMGGGLHFHRLKFSHIGSLVVLVLLAFGLRAKGRDRVLALGAAAAGLGAILAFPYARAASAALVASCVAVIVLGSPHRRLALVLGGLVALGAAGVVALKPSLRDRFASSLTNQGNGDRMLLLRAGVDAVEKYPVAGAGAGRFRAGQWVDASAPIAVREQPGKAHNQLLSVAAEFGFPGLALFVVLLVFLARRMKPSHPAGVAGLGALLFFMLLGTVHDPLFQAPFSMALVLALAIGVRSRSVGEA
jgi:O-antigen ligase